MHEETLSKKQVNLLPLVRLFSDQFGLIGGTAIALQIGHRKSIDFDLVTLKSLDHQKIRKIIREEHKITSVFVEKPEELTLVVDEVKFTFLKYPFNINFPESFKKIIRMPDLSTLGAMKAFALGRRAKWKDYVDLYFILKQRSFLEVIKKAKEIFGNEFNEKLFREQLSYFEDIDYSEKIDYVSGFETSDEIIKSKLKDISLQIFNK